MTSCFYTNDYIFEFHVPIYATFILKNHFSKSITRGDNSDRKLGLFLLISTEHFNA